MAKTAQVSRVTLPRPMTPFAFSQGAPLVQHLPSVPAALGWNDHQAALAADLPPGLIFGRVARADRGRASVLTASGTLHPSTRDPVAVGDWVGVDPGGERIHGVLPRRSSITRRDPGQATGELVLAANVDRVLVVHAANRPVNQRRLERELVLAWETGAVPAVVLTKIDLCPDPDGAVADAEAVAIGAEVLAVSNVSGQGLDRRGGTAPAGHHVRRARRLGRGQVDLAQPPGRRRASSAPSRSGRPTVAAGTRPPPASWSCCPAAPSSSTRPGVKALGLWDAGEGMAQVFADIEELAPSCRFADCEHRTEPGCAVRDVVGEDRLNSWRKLAPGAGPDLGRAHRARQGRGAPPLEDDPQGQPRPPPPPLSI